MKGTVGKSEDETLSLLTCMVMDNGAWGREGNAIDVRNDGAWEYEYFTDGRAPDSGIHAGFTICAIVSSNEYAAEYLQPTEGGVDTSKIHAHDCVDGLTLLVPRGWK